MATLNTGTVATLTAQSGGVDVQGAVAYVWRLWDSSSKVTTNGIIQAPVNRPLAFFTANVFDAYGRYVGQTCYGYPAVQAPSLVRVTAAQAVQQVLPYYVTIISTATDPGSITVFTWRNAAGDILAESVPAVDGNRFQYTHKVTELNEVLTVTLADQSGIGATCSVDLSLPGVVNYAPKLAPLSTVLKPQAYNSTLAPVLCATIATLANIAGSPTVDSIPVPPLWEKITTGAVTEYVAGVPARVLVRNQYNAADNGVYLATSTSLSYTYKVGMGVEAGRVVVDSSGLTAYFSDVDSDAVDVSLVVADHLVEGRYFILTDGTNSDKYIIGSVAAISNGYSASVTRVGTTVISDDASVTVSFSWVRSSDVYSKATTVRVIASDTANENSGDYFAIVTDSAALTGGSDLHFVKCNIAGDAMYFESAAIIEDGLAGSVELDLLGEASDNALSAKAQNLIRAKIDVSGVTPGSYTATAKAQDELATTGFVPAVAETSAVVIFAQF